MHGLVTLQNHCCKNLYKIHLKGNKILGLVIFLLVSRSPKTYGPMQWSAAVILCQLELELGTFAQLALEPAQEST